MNEYTYVVAGMTCDNCKRHVTQALSDLPGVSAVDVDLDSGKARLRAERILTDREVGRALDEAGYELA
jgi:Cu+-exporting ATPase